MKKLVIVLLVAINIAAIVGGLAYSVRNTPPERIFWEEMPENTNVNLKYFGYYHFGGNVIEEVASFGHSNMCKLDGDDDELKRLLDNGFQVFIMIRHMFFKNNETPADWSTRWAKVKAAIDPHIDQILGFYVDEPVRLDIFSNENIGKSMQSFHFACQQVRQDYPDKRMMSVLTINDIKNYDYSREYYKYCTDLGYDFYPRWDRDDVLSDINTLETQIAVNNQAIWLIPKAFYTVLERDSDLYWLIEDRTIPIGQDILDWIKGSYEIAVADHRITGIFCFVYDNDGYTASLRKFFMKDSEFYNEEIFGVYDQIGKAVIANDVR